MNVCSKLPKMLRFLLSSPLVRIQCCSKLRDWNDFFYHHYTLEQRQAGKWILSFAKDMKWRSFCCEGFCRFRDTTPALLTGMMISRLTTDSRQLFRTTIFDQLSFTESWKFLYHHYSTYLKLESSTHLLLTFVYWHVSLFLERDVLLHYFPIIVSGQYQWRFRNIEFF